MSLADIRLHDPKAAFAIARTLGLEGGLAESSGDPGGETNYGVSLRYALAEAGLHPETVRFFDIDHDGHVTRKDIVGLTADDAAVVYWQCWWLPGWYANLQPDLVAWKAFDIAVNTGPNRAALLLQKALVALGAQVAVDSVVGPRTVLAVQAEAARDQGGRLLEKVRQLQALFYSGLVAREPALRRFLDGWLRRAAA